MGFLSRRRDKAQQDDEAALADMLEMIRREQADSRAEFMTDSGDFDLRKLVVDVWEGKPTQAMQTVQSFWKPEGGEPTGERLYEDEFARHWEGLDRETRGDQIEFLASYNNRLGDQDAADGRPELEAMHALMMEKVRLLTLAYDVTYDGDYTERVFMDPRQFGVYEP